MADLLITGGRVIDPAQKIDRPLDVLIKDGKVADLAPGLSKKSALRDIPRFDAAKRWVVPGLIDMHVHLREPGREGDETIATGALAAARGGITTVLAMPNTEPASDNPALLSFLRAKAAKEACVNVLFAGAATADQKGERLTETFKLAQAGALAITDDGRPVMNAELMRRALEYAKDSGLPFLDHCEDLNLSAGACMHEGAAAAARGLKGAPSAAETVMVLRDIALCELTGARVHIAHISAASSIAAVREAKKRGLPITAEATPHHIALCDADIEGYDPNFKMNPPLRAASDRQAILEGLSDGTIDAVATDHAPHGPNKKALGMAAAPFGVIGLETSLGVCLTRLVDKKILSPGQLICAMSAAPARILGLKSKGSMRKGYDGDVTVIDPQASWNVELPFESKSRNSPFLGQKLKGRAAAAIVAGRIVYGL